MIDLNALSFIMPAFGLVNWSIVIAYLIGMIAIGHFTGRKKTNAEGYFLGGRSVPVWGVVLSTVAAILSAATFIGVPQIAFAGDCTYMILNIGGFIAFGIVATVFIPKFYRAGTITIYGYLDQRFGEKVRIATSAVFICGRIIASGARLFFASVPICMLFYHDTTYSTGQAIMAIVVLGALGIVYTVWGGIRAVIWTDSAQIIVVAGAALVTIFLLLHSIPRTVPEIYHILAAPGTGVGGHSKLLLVDTSWDLSREFTLWVALLANMPLQLATYGTDHDMTQRMLTTKSAWRGGLSAILAQCVSVCVVSLFIVIGLLLYIYYRRPDVMGSGMPTDPIPQSMKIYPQFLLNHLPMGVAGLAMAGLFAAAQGSTISAMNAMASSAVSDLYWPIRRNLGLPVDTENSRTPRIAVALMGLVLILFAIVCVFMYDPNGKRSLLDFALGIMAFSASGMLAVFLTALLTTRGNFASVLGALITGAVVVGIFQPAVVLRWSTWLGHPTKLDSQWAMPIGLATSFLVCVLGTPLRKQRHVEASALHSHAN